MNIIFLGTPSFIQPIKDVLSQHFTLVDSLKEADLAVVAAYGKILTEDELNAPKYGSINVHPSLLPKYRGPSPLQQAILNGDKVSGITIIKMDSEVDHGPIIYQESLELSDSDNFDTLSKKMFLRASEVLPKIITDFIQGKIDLRLQDSTIATYCNRLTRDNGYFDINNPPSPEVLDRMIRAYYPWPGVWTKWNNKIVKFLPSSSHPELDSGSIQFLLQIEGKKVLSLKDFLNGYPDFPLKSITLDKK